MKGANLAMEQVEAELHDWPQAPYADKGDVDASYKRMLENALRLGRPGAVRIGVASHNLFEIAYAMTVAEATDSIERIDLEMLEGMAPPQARAVRELAGSLLLYAPVVEKSDRDASIAYLSRRLDENSSPENFLRSLFDITPGSPAWDLEAGRFRSSVRARHDVTTASRRGQSHASVSHAATPGQSFANSADSDFTQGTDARLDRRCPRDHCRGGAGAGHHDRRRRRDRGARHRRAGQLGRRPPGPSGGRCSPGQPTSWSRSGDRRSR